MVPNMILWSMTAGDVNQKLLSQIRYILLKIHLNTREIFCLVLSKIAVFDITFCFHHPPSWVGLPLTPLTHHWVEANPKESKHRIGRGVGWGHGISKSTYWRKSKWKFQGPIEKVGFSAEFSWVLVFDHEISKRCHTI